MRKYLKIKNIEVINECTLLESFSLLEEILKKEYSEDYSIYYQIGRSEVLLKVVLSLLIPLRDMGLLFTPNGKKVEGLDFKLIEKWYRVKELQKLFFYIKNNKLDIDLKRVEAYFTAFDLNIENETKLSSNDIKMAQVVESQWWNFFKKL